MSLSQTLSAVRTAGTTLIDLDDATVNAVLTYLASALVSNEKTILKANEKDVAAMKPEDPTHDRLRLTPERIKGIADDVRTVMSLPSPLGIVLEDRTRPNGLHISKISVPLGVVGIIYEARPNVTVDAFTLCFKSGNACVLKGGSDAIHSNRALVSVIQKVLKKHKIDEHVVHLLGTDREETDEMLRAHEDIDVIIPRGSANLIKHVREHARVPVIETGAGIVHTYVDASADLQKASAIVLNAKTRRCSVCNSLDTLVIHRDLLPKLLQLVQPLRDHGVEIFADGESFAVLDGAYDDTLLHRAKPEHFGTEFLSLKMSIKTVGSLDEALAHIAAHGSKHSEAIVSEDQAAIDTFLKKVDAAAVYANASTGFSDGAQFGLGAEIGISTQKLHARGPMGLRELTSYKWVVRGNGQVRT